MENAEINNIIKIVGLQYKKDYEDRESLNTLRYGKIMIMTDQVRFTRTENGEEEENGIFLPLPSLYQILCIYFIILYFSGS